jgi:hypothetical protein
MLQRLENVTHKSISCVAIVSFLCVSHNYVLRCEAHATCISQSSPTLEGGTLTPKEHGAVERTTTSTTRRPAVLYMMRLSNWESQVSARRGDREACLTIAVLQQRHLGHGPPDNDRPITHDDQRER